MSAIKHFVSSSHRPNDQYADERIEKEKRSPYGFFITRYRLVFLLLFAVVVGGFLALLQIPRESDPEVKIPIAVVSTVYLGASPSDIESLITNKIESKIENLDNVKLITSQSNLGISSIVVEFRAEADLKDSIRELKDAVAEVAGLPSESEDPFVTEIRANDQPIITFSIAGDLSDEQLKQLGETIQDELESIPGVSSVPLSGVRDREFSVNVDRTSLERLGLSLGSVIGAISSVNVDAPLGDITIEAIDYNLRAVSKFKDIDDIKNVVVTVRPDGSPILVSDVAVVEDRLKEATTFSRISLNGEPVKNTASFQILKKTGGNILQIVDESKKRLEKMKQSGVIPVGVEIESSTDFSQFIRDDLRILGRSGIQSTILIFILLLLALSFKEALIALLSIPLTFLITFIILNAYGFSLNGLTLFSLVLSLGLLVDTFIVILEGIFHNMRIGYGAYEAALLSVAHYKKPLYSGVFTTIAAFVPMLLVSGILGEYLKWLPITISITLLSSLFVTFIIVPALAAVFMRRKYAEETKKESLLEKYLTNALRAAYRKNVMMFLTSKRKKIIFSISISILFTISVGLLAFGIIPVQLFPRADVDFTFINVEMPIGTDLKETGSVVSKIEDYLYTRDDVKSFVATVGRGSSFGTFGSSSQAKDNLAGLTVNLVDLKERDLKSFDINEELRHDLESIKEGKITIQDISNGPPTGAPIEARITGTELSQLSKINSNLVSVLEGIDGVIDVTSNEDVSPADLTFTLNKDAVARSGLTIPEVTGFLRSAIFGVTATEVTIDGRDVDVVVKLDDGKITSVDEIQNLSIVSSRGTSVKLSHIADFSLEPALATIHHRDFDRTITVQANLEPGFTVGKVLPKVQSAMQEYAMPSGYAIQYGGEVEDIEQSFTELWNAMTVAILLIILILVLQFDSFIKPFIIALSFPLIIVGVAIGVLILHLPFSFSVFLGVVALAGISVNDAIVLVDKADRNMIEKNMDPLTAIADAGDSRLQPILLTTITTVIGIVPLAFADEFWIGLSVAISFGLAFATIMQLYVIPMLFVRFIGRPWHKKNQGNKRDDIPNLEAFTRESGI